MKIEQFYKKYLFPGVVFQFVEGIEDRPVQRVSGLLQGIPDQDMGEGVEDRDVILETEGVDVLEGIGREYGVPGCDTGHSVN